MGPIWNNAGEDLAQARRLFVSHLGTAAPQTTSGQDGSVKIWPIASEPPVSPTHSIDGLLAEVDTKRVPSSLMESLH